MKATITLLNKAIGEFHYDSQEYRFAENGYILVTPKGKETVIGDPILGTLIFTGASQKCIMKVSKHT